MTEYYKRIFSGGDIEYYRFNDVDDTSIWERDTFRYEYLNDTTLKWHLLFSGMAEVVETNGTIITEDEVIKFITIKELER